MTAVVSDVVSSEGCGERTRAVGPFVAAVLGITVLAFILAGFLPITFSIVTVFVLWPGFLVDYPLTRDIYFSVAILHVLAEVPFLLRLL